MERQRHAAKVALTRYSGSLFSGMNEAHIWEVNSDGIRPVGIKKKLAIAQRFHEQISCNRCEWTRGKGIAKCVPSLFERKKENDAAVGLHTRIRNSERLVIALIAYQSKMRR